MATFLLGVLVTAIGVLALITEVFELSYFVAGPPVALSAAIVIFSAVTAAPRR